VKSKPPSKSSKFVDLSTKSSEQPLIEDMASKRIRRKRNYYDNYNIGDKIDDKSFHIIT
jgi:hypothetical protein